jgi:pimeloyl-ACP methyl ester carboxylesterase
MQLRSSLAIASLVLAAHPAWAEPNSDSPAAGAASFYVWHDEIPAQPGKLLRQEPLQERLVLENAEAGLRILYASQGWDDRPIAVSGDVLIPKGEAPAKGWPVLAWSHGTVGVADVCAPSFKGRSERDTRYLNRWLAEGYAIVSTDYEGLGTPGTHAYLHCQSEANGNIDAVRAARQLGLGLSKTWMVMGQSQGGQGALCTGAHAAQRAPELDFRGTLATAPAVNWKQRFAAGKPDDPNPFIGMSLLLARGFEVYEPTFSSAEAFSDAGLALLPLTDTLCVGELIGIGMRKNLTQGESLKIVPFGDIAGTANGAAKMEVPLQGFSAPVYVAQGTADPLIRFEDVHGFSVDLCGENVDVTLDVYEGAKHSGPLNTGFDTFKAWVAGRFANAPAKGNCDGIEKLTE